MSHPVWVRGLKHTTTGTHHNVHKVAPCMGAWIETIAQAGKAQAETMSHPVWVRGLKQYHVNTCTIEKQSHPVWVRGLKPTAWS